MHIFSAFFKTVPTAAPENLTLLSLTSRNLLVSWQSPPVAEQNGQITHYLVIVEDQNGVNIRELQTEYLNLYVEGLKPFHIYSVHVAASTKIGLGPHGVPFLIEMPEDGTCNYIPKL